MRGPWALALLLLCASIAGAALAQNTPQRTVTVTLHDQGCPDGGDRFCITPAEIQIAEGDTVTLRLKNDGQVRHNLTFASGTPEVLAKHATGEPIAPNATHEIEIPWEDIETAMDDADGRRFELRCGFEGHAALGETAALIVQGEGQNPQPLGWPLVVAGLIGAALVAGRQRT